MDNQYETLIPSRLEDITLFSHQTNSSKPKSIIGFNTSIYSNIMEYF